MTARLNEGIRVETADTCLLCRHPGAALYDGGRDRAFGVAGVWGLSRCPSCRLVWLNPRPMPEEIGKLYAGYYTHAVPSYPAWLVRGWTAVRNSVLASRLGYAELARSLVLRIMGAALSWIGPVRELVVQSVKTLDGRSKGKLLDVGCGNGKFLSNMRELGWDVAGVEPDGGAAQVARERFGLTVHEGRLDDAGFPDGTFDAITLHHVIEHVLDPVHILQTCRRVLKPGGRLVVVTPNVESLGHRLMRSAWREIDSPRHLFLFSQATLRTCAERAGVEVLTLRTTESKAREIWSASRLIRRHGRLPNYSLDAQGLWLFAEGLAFQAAEHGLRRLSEAGEELVMVATVRP